MSTGPGNDAWRDAGLDEQGEDAVSLVEEVEDDDPGVEDPVHEVEEYPPRTPRPGLECPGAAGAGARRAVCARVAAA